MRQRIQIGLTDRRTRQAAREADGQTDGADSQTWSWPWAGFRGAAASTGPDVFFSHISVRFLWHNVDSPVEPVPQTLLRLQLPPLPTPGSTPARFIYGMDFFVAADFSLVFSFILQRFFFAERVCRVEKLV